MSVITRAGHITQRRAFLVWAGPIVVASIEVSWLADRVAELLADYGIDDVAQQEIVISYANVVPHDNVWVAWIGRVPAIVCHHYSMARRITELLDAYGLADIPDTIDEVLDEFLD